MLSMQAYIVIPSPRLNVRKHFFLERVLPHWNALPIEVLRQHNYNDFKRMLRNHFHL